MSFDAIPLWAIFVGIVGLSTVCIECGFRQGVRQRALKAHETEAQLGPVIASTLGLLAFMLAFVFNIAASRFDERRVMLMDEANAIGTTYLRAEFLDNSTKIRVRKLLREYTGIRSRQIPTGSVQEAIAKSESLQDKLWAETATVARANMTSPICALFIESLNETIDLHEKRVVLAVYTRVPLVVWICLITITALSMSGVGYLSGLSGNRSRTETTILVASVSLVMTLVADLDRPTEGFLQNSQRPLVDLYNKLGPP